MPLPLPNLDDRNWQELVEEGRALIPRFSPEWTDHNVHDPGITMVELFAWLAEMTAYRLNRVPARHVLKFLALAGFHPRQPRPSHLLLSLPTGPFPANPEGLPAGAVFETQPGGIPFRTLRNLQLVEAELTAVQVETVADASSASTFSDRTLAWREGSAFATFGEIPRPGAALYLGFSTLPTQRRLSIGLLGAGFEDPRKLRESLLDDVRSRRAFCRRPLPDFECTGTESTPDDEIELLPPHHSASLTWEFSTGDPAAPWAALEAVDGSPEEGQVTDLTRSLTLNGVVEVQLPVILAATSIGVLPDPFFYLRCRLAEGGFDAAPRLQDIVPNSVPAEQSAPVFQSFSILAGVVATGPDPVPGTNTGIRLVLTPQANIAQLDFVADGSEPEVRVLSYRAATATEAGELVTELRSVGEGDGFPEQRIDGLDAAIEAESLRLFTLAAGRLVSWLEQPDLDASDRVDRHFVLDTEAGEIQFGDGEHGRLPGAQVPNLASWRQTGGDAGNLPAGQVLALADNELNRFWLDAFPAADRTALLEMSASNPAPGLGGRDLESIDSALGRAIAVQHAHQRLLDLCRDQRCSTLDDVAGSEVDAIPAPTRAVNLLDLERLARATPGTRIARARAWPGVDPDFACLPAAGFVTILILPDLSGPSPKPTQGLLAAVRRFLQRHRMVTTRVEVVAPEYVEVGVDATVVLCPYADPARIAAEVEDRIDRFFDPRSGGPRGLGWPFGRDVIRSEMLQLIDNVAGVDFVRRLRLRADSAEPTCGNIRLCPTHLIRSGTHNLTIEEHGHE